MAASRPARRGRGFRLTRGIDTVTGRPRAADSGHVQPDVDPIDVDCDAPPALLRCQDGCRQTH
jgi:hypothetical protein